MRPFTFPSSSSALMSSSMAPIISRASRCITRTMTCQISDKHRRLSANHATLRD